MGYLETHRGLVSKRTTIPPTSALRGRVYELRYDSETATKTKYIVLGINIYPKAGGRSKQLLHCLDLDEIIKSIMSSPSISAAAEEPQI